MSKAEAKRKVICEIGNYSLENLLCIGHISYDKENVEFFYKQPKCFICQKEIQGGFYGLIIRPTNKIDGLSIGNCCINHENDSNFQNQVLLYLKNNILQPLLISIDQYLNKIS